MAEKYESVPERQYKRKWSEKFSNEKPTKNRIAKNSKAKTADTDSAALQTGQENTNAMQIRRMQTL